MPANFHDRLRNERRVRQVVEWILSGHTTADIIRQCTTSWELKERAAYKYLKKAKDFISKFPDDDTKEKKSLHIERRLKLFRELEKKTTAQGARTALRILDSIAKIDGSLVEKVDVTTGGEQIGTVLILPANGREGK
jgi:hypothetical protein